MPFTGLRLVLTDFVVDLERDVDDDFVIRGEELVIV